jgi:hypothetical protein
MKTTIKKVNEYTHKSYTINYGNKVTCDVVLKDDKLVKYSFKNGKKHLNLVKDINIYINTHWSKHYEIKDNISEIKSEVELINFTDFDNLFHIGGYSDGSLRNYNLEHLSSIIMLDSIFCKIYHKINTLKKSQNVKKICDKLNWVKSCEIVEIPYYNRLKDKHTHSVNINVLPTKEMMDNINKIMKDDCIDDDCKSYLMNLILEK